MSNSKPGQQSRKAKPSALLPEVAAEETLHYCSRDMPRQLWIDLKAGKIQPDAILDLHGLTLEEAKKVLEKFLHQAHARDWVMVKVIHGKGGQDTQRYPVLKNMVNQLLRSHSQVLAFTSTPPRFGGTGAVYVWLENSES